MSYYSPSTGRELVQFAGSPTTIGTTAEQYKTLGTAMITTATTLRDITESQVSAGTDRLKDDAEKLEGDLRKAGVRYQKTGEALTPYATALEDARAWFTAHSASVVAAEKRYVTAQNTQQTLLYSPTYGMEEAEVKEHGEKLGDAATELESAETDRASEWRAFDSAYDLWDAAFETAANGVSDAMDKADNDDGKWDWIADALGVLGYVLIVLAVVALFVVTSPWAAILLATTIALSAVHLAGNIYLYANGKASLSDVLWSAVGLLTAGIGGLASRSLRLATAANGGADVLQASQSASRLPVFANGVRMQSMPTIGAAWKHPFSVLMRGNEWGVLSQWGPELAQWTASTAGRSGTIASAWADMIVTTAPKVGGAGWTAVGSWVTGIGAGLYSAPDNPWYVPFGRP